MFAHLAYAHDVDTPIKWVTVTKREAWYVQSVIAVWNNLGDVTPEQSPPAIKTLKLKFWAVLLAPGGEEAALPVGLSEDELWVVSDQVNWDVRQGDVPVGAQIGQKIALALTELSNEAAVRTLVDDMGIQGTRDELDGNGRKRRMERLKKKEVKARGRANKGKARTPGGS